ncbi:MAG TPA: hypothetical protein VF665_16435 [Longimicrobium sp.]|jgi:hypothetical protein|uniref:hypothetical protein n=1 Tax=Longimicrobium sp. TaxID=2029185 RepID=UPI002EDA84B7
MSAKTKDAGHGAFSERTEIVSKPGAAIRLERTVLRGELKRKLTADGVRSLGPATSRDDKKR